MGAGRNGRKGAGSLHLILFLRHREAAKAFPQASGLSTTFKFGTPPS